MTEKNIDSGCQRIGRNFTAGAIQTVAIIVVLAYLVRAMLSWALPPPTDVTDQDRDHRSGVELVTDYGTGCQYLRLQGGGLYPRLNVTGRQICTK